MLFRDTRGLEQRLAVADLLIADSALLSGMASKVFMVYSDPPWNPGNEKWWRRYAGVDPPSDYCNFLDSWCRCVAACAPEHVFCEQSVNDKHRAMLANAISRCGAWSLALMEEWTTFYGSPSRPNKLMHFGTSKLRTDPTGLRGEEMTRRVFAGFSDVTGVTVVDPCVGRGMTSRMAHASGWNFVGSELNPKRLDCTVGWLLKHGYKEVTDGH